MKHKNIRLNHVRVESSLHYRHYNTSNLIDSIKNLGLKEPLLVNPADLSLISGRRRYNACEQLGMVTVRVAMPSDVLEACTELGTHVIHPDPMYAMPMDTRQRLDLSLRLNALPRPADKILQKFSHDTHTGPAVGFSSRILWRLRSTLLKANEDEESPAADSIAARRILALMLEALESPVGDHSHGQIIGRLHTMLREGTIPDHLGALAPPTRRTKKIPEQTTKQENSNPSPQRVLRKRSPTEFGRGVDMISGALTGLESLMYANLPAGEEAAHLRNELRKSQKSIRQMLKSLQEETQ